MICSTTGFTVHRSSFPKLGYDSTVEWADNSAFPNIPENNVYLPFPEELTKLDALLGVI
jgi:hypothetical protein